MTDRLKGVIVTFSKEIREDDAEETVNAIRMIKGVLSVRECVANADDYMMYEMGYTDCRRKIFEILKQEVTRPQANL